MEKALIRIAIGFVDQRSDSELGSMRQNSLDEQIWNRSEPVVSPDKRLGEEQLPCHPSESRPNLAATLNVGTLAPFSWSRGPNEVVRRQVNGAFRYPSRP